MRRSPRAPALCLGAIGIALSACATAGSSSDEDAAIGNPDAAIIVYDARPGADGPALADASTSPDGLGTTDAAATDAAATPDGAITIDAAAPIDAPPPTPDAMIPIDAPPATPDAAPMIDAAPSPDAGCTPVVVNLLSNPSFDSGPGGGWTEAGTYAIIQLQGDPNLPDYLTPIPSPSYGAWLGGYDDADDTLYQNLTVPAGATNLNISFSKWLETQDSLITAYDYAYVELQTSGGSLLERYNPAGHGTYTWDNTDEQRSWVVANWTPTGSYAGQTIRLSFRVTTDFLDSSSLFLDSVAVNVTVCQ
jgi:hypothetical protein